MSRNLPLLPNGPVPIDAKRAFTGDLFDVYQWDQKMYDGTSKVFEMIRRADAALVIPVLKDNTILMTEQEQPNKPAFISLAGGRLDPNETPEQAAHRELLEETGYRTEQLVPWFHFSPLSKMDWTIYVYIAKDCEKVADQNLDNGEKVTLKPVSFDEFVDISTNDPLFRDIEITERVLRAQLDPNKMYNLKKLLIGEDSTPKA